MRLLVCSELLKEVGKVTFFVVIFSAFLGLLDRISPPGISQIRKISQLAVCDILYYMSPLYGLEVISFMRNGY